MSDFQLNIGNYLPWDINKPLIPRFRANTVGRAFLLNAIATALIAWAAVEIRFLLDGTAQPASEGICTIITLSTTFAAALVIYVVLYILFNFGGGMMVDKNSSFVEPIL